MTWKVGAEELDLTTLDQFTHRAGISEQVRSLQGQVHWRLRLPLQEELTSTREESLADESITEKIKTLNDCLPLQDDTSRG